MEEVRWLGFNITDQCNLDCIYCFADAKRKGVFLDRNAVSKALDFFSLRTVPNAKITFGGGEPTTHPDLVEIVDSTGDALIDPKIIIYSNGVLSKSRLKKLLDRKAFFNITFEGLPKIHDSERYDHSGKGTSRQVISTIKTILDEAPDQLVLRYNHSKNKDGKEEEIIDFFEELGVKKLALSTLIAMGRGNSYDNVAPIESVRGLMKIEKMADEKGISTSFSKRPKSVDHWPSCGAGINSFSITADSKITVCSNILTAKDLPPSMEYAIVGEIGETVRIYKKKLEDFVKFARHVPESCKSCSAFRYCSGCPLEKVKKDGEIIFKQSFCDNNVRRFKMRDLI